MTANYLLSGMVGLTCLCGATARADAPLTTAHFWMRAFIPSKLPKTPGYILQTDTGATAIPAPSMGIADFRLGPLKDTCFLTDNRDFVTLEDAPSRVGSDIAIVFHNLRDITVEFPKGDGGKSIGFTHDVDCKSGRDVAPPQQAALNTINIGPVSSSGFMKVFNIKASSSNPFYSIFGVSFAPAIDYEVVFQYDFSSLTLTIHGVVGSFPSFEMYANIAADNLTIAQVSPPAGATASLLFDFGTGANMVNFDYKIDMRKYLLH